MEVFKKYNSPESMDNLSKANLQVQEIEVKLQDNLNEVLKNQVDLDVRISLFRINIYWFRNSIKTLTISKEEPMLLIKELRT